MIDIDLASLIEQARQRVQDIALLIANEPQENVVEVLNIFCTALLEDDLLTAEQVQPLVDAICRQRRQCASKASSLSRH